ncbi:MAG: hypothetical protein KJZ86_19425 [Caldilineaceae bacterium]|nr:hypothetical protein [Caldilineaceae bacterium]
MGNDSWSKTEKQAARRAFDLAYRRECEAISGEVRRQAAAIIGPDDLWGLHNFLTQQRKETDEKYDYRYSQLEIVFARLVVDGWLQLDELAGLAKEKLNRIGAIVGWAAERDEG